jgi:alpha-ribazole phosphatase
VTRWWLLRHAPVINPEGVFYGRSEIPADLSDRAALSACAARLPAGAVWLATPASRTWDTVLALGGCEPVIEPDFAEQDFGAWQGLGPAALAVARGADFWAAPGATAPPGGESFAAMVPRVAAALARHGAAWRDRDVIVVTHAGTIRAALAVALGLDPERALAFVIDPLSLTRLDAIAAVPGPDVWRIGGVNL